MNHNNDSSSRDALTLTPVVLVRNQTNTAHGGVRSNECDYSARIDSYGHLVLAKQQLLNKTLT